MRSAEKVGTPTLNKGPSRRDILNGCMDNPVLLALHRHAEQEQAANTGKVSVRPIKQRLNSDNSHTDTFQKRDLAAKTTAWRVLARSCTKHAAVSTSQAPTLKSHNCAQISLRSFSSALRKPKLPLCTSNFKTTYSRCQQRRDAAHVDRRCKASCFRVGQATPFRCVLGGRGAAHGQACAASFGRRPLTRSKFVALRHPKQLLLGNTFVLAACRPALRLCHQKGWQAHFLAAQSSARHAVANHRGLTCHVRTSQLLDFGAIVHALSSRLPSASETHWSTFGSGSNATASASSTPTSR